jgi:hypothetical protein
LQGFFLFSEAQACLMATENTKKTESEG